METACEETACEEEPAWKRRCTSSMDEVSVMAATVSDAADSRLGIETSETVVPADVTSISPCTVTKSGLRVDMRSTPIIAFEKAFDMALHGIALS